MTAVRARFGAVLEWFVAAVFLLATLTVASLIVRELRAVPSASLGVSEREPAPARLGPSMPAVVPAGAVSVPVLPLAGESEIRVGDSCHRIAELLGRAAESGRQEVDRGAFGSRLTRFYEYVGVRFILVFEPFEQEGDLRVAAIYLR